MAVGRYDPAKLLKNRVHGGGDSGGENFVGKISPLRKVAKFPPGEIFAARDPGFFLVRVAGEYCPLRHVVWCTRQQRPEQAQYCCAMTHEMTGTFHSPP